MTKNAATEAPPREKVEEGDYGVVYIAEGALTGQLGYYEDDGAGAIVYLGYPLLSDSCRLRRSWLRKATPEENARFRAEHMTQEALDQARERMEQQSRENN